MSSLARACLRIVVFGLIVPACLVTLALFAVADVVLGPRAGS